MTQRYKHWFWNSKLMIKFSHAVTRFSSWLWRRMYGKKEG